MQVSERRRIIEVCARPILVIVGIQYERRLVWRRLGIFHDGENRSADRPVGYVLKPHGNGFCFGPRIVTCRIEYRAELSIQLRVRLSRMGLRCLLSDTNC